MNVGIGIATWGLLVASAACAGMDHQHGPLQVVDSPRRADVTFQFLPDPGRIAPHLANNQVFHAPVALETPLPEFPPDAHAGVSAPVTLVVRIVVDEAGSVQKILGSPLAAPGSDIDVSFRAAVEDAVRAWSFVPAAICTLAPGEDLDHDSNPDYMILVESTRVPAYLDVRFTFEIVEGRGRVRLESGA